MSSRIKVGVFGGGRGKTFMDGATKATGLELVAICEQDENKINRLKGNVKDGVAFYNDFDEFIQHDMDAVILANYFHEHASFAIKALESGKHVMSECTACGTMAEGVELVKAVEKSGLIYLLAENYPYSAIHHEMRRLYTSGSMGKFQYGEAEYVHAFDAETIKSLAPFPEHWRNWMPRTYYCTHAIGPVMYITETKPVKVNGFIMPYDYDDPVIRKTQRQGDTGSVLMLEMDNGAQVKILQGNLRGHGSGTRIHCNRGKMEAANGNISIRRDRWDLQDDDVIHSSYTPNFPVFHEEASKTGHGGGDFFCNYYFAEAIKSGKQPFFDVYKGLEMSACGILGYRSALEGGTPYEIPDFKDPASYEKYANDNWTPDPKYAHIPDQPSSSVLGKIKHS